MPTYAHNLISTVTVGAGGQSSITFSNIPQTYTDLYIEISGRSSDISGNWGGLDISFNGGAASANMTSRRLYGIPTTITTDAPTSGTFGVINGNGNTANSFGSSSIHILNYTSNQNKALSIDATTEHNGSSAFMFVAGGLWSSTAAITSITLAPTGFNIAQYSTFYLYGITSLANAAKATGGIITTDGTYWIHTFKSTGTFTPTQNLTNVDYLVVAGGGGSGTAGGGAGGLRSTVTATGGGGSLESKVSMSSGVAYTVTVGAGGTATANCSDVLVAGNGSNSSISGSGFTTITSTGGGGAPNWNAGTSGGSGSGAGRQNVQYNGGAGTANQGYAGGKNYTSSKYGTGGGGGAGAVGGDANSSTSGSGGAGVAVAISGSSVYYAGGGGGGGDNEGTGLGSGGNGGGAGGTNSVGANGTANTGGGAGGGKAESVNAGGTGGSGIVIVRYAI